MLEKYINKKVEISEKMYSYSSTIEGKFNNGHLNKIIGTITAIDDNFIQLDNNTLVAIKFIYRIEVIN